MKDESVRGIFGVVTVGLLVWTGVSWYEAKQVDYSKPWWSGTSTQVVCKIPYGSIDDCYTLNTGSDGSNVEAIYFNNGGYVAATSSECTKSAAGQSSDRFCRMWTEDGDSWDILHLD